MWVETALRRPYKTIQSAVRNERNGFGGACLCVLLADFAVDVVLLLGIVVVLLVVLPGRGGRLGLRVTLNPKPTLESRLCEHVYGHTVWLHWAWLRDPADLDKEVVVLVVHSVAPMRLYAAMRWKLTPGRTAACGMALGPPK